MGRQEIRFQSTDYGQGIIVCMGKIQVLHFKVKGALVFLCQKYHIQKRGLYYER